ncbi:hypothetical protein L2D14_01365 [Thalassospiraceae bacterium LMO-JJ14]|nr:hypothetical protein L2D14_01365 [Thalassospiraceae bacterium LMO-JJ14]
MSTNAGRAEPAQTPKTFTACFSVVAQCDPNTLSRILEPFTKRGLTPSHVYAMRTGETGDAMHVDLQLADADAETNWRLANDLRGLHLVRTVLTSQKSLAGAI